MDALWQALLNQLLTNPVLQGVVVSLLIARLRAWFSALDAAAKDPAQVKWVQLLVVVLSFLSTLASDWASGQLSSITPAMIQAFLTTVISALGVHTLGTDVKAAVAAKK